MKRKIILVLFCIVAAAVSTQAQEVTVKSPSTDLKVEFKRCIANDDMAFIDILITNKSNRDTKIDCRDWITVYDDEGNVYGNKNLDIGKYNVYIATSSTDNQPLNSRIEIPAGIAYKVRIIMLGGFDKYATIVKLLKIEFAWNVFDTKISGSWVNDAIELREIPITRE